MKKTMQKKLSLQASTVARLTDIHGGSIFTSSPRTYLTCVSCDEACITPTRVGCPNTIMCTIR